MLKNLGSPNVHQNSIILQRKQHCEQKEQKKEHKALTNHSSEY